LADDHIRSFGHLTAYWDKKSFGHTFGLADWPKLAERAKRFGHFTVAMAADWPTNIFGVSAI
jgi:hypothetical protein